MLGGGAGEGRWGGGGMLRVNGVGGLRWCGSRSGWWWRRRRWLLGKGKRR
uniref:Uncharacterized protein n=1 Tax=Arundo donax TaxID=35708 RepID=A0A0A9F096_ARUDO